MQVRGFCRYEKFYDNYRLRKNNRIAILKCEQIKHSPVDDRSYCNKIKDITLISSNILYIQRHHVLRIK